jgi:hypothetical protein
MCRGGELFTTDAHSGELANKDYLDARLKELKFDRLKWVAGMLMAQITVLAALVEQL